MRFPALLVTLTLAACGSTGPSNGSTYTLSFDAVEAIYEVTIPLDSSAPLVPHLVFADTLPSYDISWSPDGSRVAFTREYNGAGGPTPPYWRVVVYDTRTGIQQALTSGSDDSFQPAWSPDGAHIAYLSRPNGGFEAFLRLVRPDGTDDRPLGSTPLFVRRPRWSPNSRLLVAVDVNLNLVLLDGTTGDTVRTLGPGLNPDWSPDGRQFVFALDTAIALADTRGHISRTISVTAYDVSWSPDGRWLAFDGGNRIGILPALALDTLDLRVIGAFSRPAWRHR
jgi:Tol biopolymer transport system component